ncbi:MAG: hypothetical protein ACE5KW_04040 [Dehalococcoidia bacterium]
MQQVAFKLGYSLVVATLFILFVILGTRTFYAEPEGPEYPEPMFAHEPFEPAPIFCEPDGRCFNEATGQEVPLEEVPQEQQEFIKAEQEFMEKEEAFISEERAPYHRNVFILAGFLGVAAIAAGLALFRRVEAMPLGLMLGGLGVIIYGWAQAAEDFEEIGEAPLFAAAAVGLAVVLAAGYWFLGTRQPTGQD